MKLPKLITDALSHRCGYLRIAESQIQASSGAKHPLKDEQYWYMHPGHAEFVREWLTQVGSTHSLFESENISEWDASRPIQINVVETAKNLRKLGITW